MIVFYPRFMRMALGVGCSRVMHAVGIGAHASVSQSH
jgi:hypothetical protein